MPQPVLVSGRSSGIGLAVATHLAARGVPVYATVRSDVDAARLARIDGIEALICDVTDDAQVAHLRTTLDTRGDGLWGIVHDAGIAHLGHLTTMSLDVAAACHAALFDEAPLERYLVVPNAEEADRTLEQAAHEWARLNASTPQWWSSERLVAAVGAGAVAAAEGHGSVEDGHDLAGAQAEDGAGAVVHQERR